MDAIERIVFKAERFKKRVLKLIDFIKLGWEDNDWDYGYTYTLLHYKFKKQAEYFEKLGIAQDNKYTAKICRVLYKCIERFEQKEGFDYFNMYADKKLPFKTDFKFVPMENSSNRIMVTVYEGTDIPLSTADEELKMKIIRRAANFEHRMTKKYRKIFYRTMYKNMEKLWD